MTASPSAAAFRAVRAPKRRENDHRQELDRGHRPEREAVDGDVETDVHHRERRAEREHDRASFAIESRKSPPRPSPEGEHRRSACDSEPGDAERVDPGEEEHRERRPEVVEDRAPDEERLGTGSRCDLLEHTSMVAGVLR